MTTDQMLDNDLTWLATQNIRTRRQLVDACNALSSWESPTPHSNDIAGDTVAVFWANLQSIVENGDRCTVPDQELVRSENA